MYTNEQVQQFWVYGKWNNPLLYTNNDNNGFKIKSDGTFTITTILKSEFTKNSLFGRNRHFRSNKAYVFIRI